MNYGTGAIGAIDAVRGVDTDEKKIKMPVEQPQVAFINTIFEGFGSNNSGSEAAFNA